MRQRPPDSPSPISGDAPLTLVTLGAAALRGAPDPSGTPGPVLLGQGKPLAVLTYLALSPERVATRDHLLDLFWADLSPERAQHSLRQLTWHLRQTLGDDCLVSIGPRLKLQLPIVVDRDQFLESVSRGDLEEAVARYAGPFLPGFASPGGAESEHWMDQERERLRGVFVRTAEELVREYLTGGRFRDAHQLAERVREADPESERAWRLVIECLLQIKRPLALAEADALERLLSSSHRAPSPATTALLRVVRQAAPADEATSDAGLVSQMVGRESEFAAILHLWQECSRGSAGHLHLSAPAGLGKTRLLGDVTTRLRSTGAAVVSLRAVYGERVIAYAFAAELARALTELPGTRGISPAAAAALVSLSPALSSIFPSAPDTATGEDALRRRTLALSELVHTAAEEQPLALLIDDAHWADDSSLQIVMGILERLGAAHVMVVTASRPTRSSTIRLEQSHSITLSPLTESDIAALLVSLGKLPQEAWARSLPSALREATAGVPLLILESLRLALEQGILVLGAEGWSCPAPALLEAALQAGSALHRRIEQLDRDSRWLLILLATAGIPIDLTTLSVAAERPTEAVEFALGLLERRGFVQRSGALWELAHDEIAEAIRHVATAEVEVAAHAALGTALLGTAGASESALLRAGRHLHAGAKRQELKAAFARWVRCARQQQDPRSSRDLAAEFLGKGTDREELARLSSSLPMTLRYYFTGPQRIAAAAVVLVGVIGTAALQRAQGPPPDTLLSIAGTDSTGDSSGLTTALRREAWEARDPILPASSRATHDLLLLRGAREVRTSPDGKAWVYDRIVPGAASFELFLLEHGRPERRLTFAARDDTHPDWSPDSRWIVLSTARWSPENDDDSDIGILDVEHPDSVRPLTSGPAADIMPFWAPDGTRIAFLRRRYDLKPTELCQVTVDGQSTECLTLKNQELSILLGWLNSRAVVVMADGGSGPHLMRISLPGGEATEWLPQEEVLQSVMSPDGRWIAAQTRASPQASPNWRILPTDDPGLARRLNAPSGLAVNQFVWTVPSARDRFLERIRIDPPPRQWSIGVPSHLSATGFDVLGDTMELPALVERWRVRDTAIASIDATTGMLTPKREGVVVVEVSAGGWRRDSVRITVAGASPSPVLEETWRDSVQTRWSFWGDPLPTIVRESDGRRSFWTRGDLSFPSGAYSLADYDVSDGFGVEAQVSTKITTLKWQFLRIEVVPYLDSLALTKWTDRSEPAPVRQASYCAAVYPGGTGLMNLGRISLESSVSPGPLNVRDNLQSGKWYRLRLQVFPDGSCGLALDGVALGRTPPTLKLGPKFRILMDGQSVGTRLLVGPLEAWRGVRTDVDWGRLLDRESEDRQNGTASAESVSASRDSSLRSK